MIRAAGVLALVASLSLLGLLLRSIHSVEVSATVLKDVGMNLTTSSSGGMVPVYLRFPKDPGSDEFRQYFDAGIRIPLIAETGGGAPKTYGVLLWPEIADALRPEDELLLSSRRFQFSVGEHRWEWVRMHGEVRRGLDVRLVGSPRNAKFTVVVGSIVGAPIVLWGLAAGIWALSRLRRGPSTSLPDSRGTPGSP